MSYPDPPYFVGRATLGPMLLNYLTCLGFEIETANQMIEAYRVWHDANAMYRLSMGDVFSWVAIRGHVRAMMALLPKERGYSQFE